MLIIIGSSKSGLSYKKKPFHTPKNSLFGIKLDRTVKISRVPSPRNPAVYKTNLTNRHEKKILMSVTKVMI